MTKQDLDVNREKKGGEERGREQKGRQNDIANDIDICKVLLSYGYICIIVGTSFLPKNFFLTRNVTFFIFKRRKSLQIFC